MTFIFLPPVHNLTKPKNLSRFYIFSEKGVDVGSPPRSIKKVWLGEGAGLELVITSFGAIEGKGRR
jgi:hypothetical protein